MTIACDDAPRLASIRRTVVVSGPLALSMRRLRAAQNSEIGIEVLTLSQLAARLAGGFVQPVARGPLHAAVRSALDEGGLTEMAHVSSLPGMPRAVATTLMAAWNADLDLSALAASSGRLADLALLDRRVRGLIASPSSALPDLRDAALAAVHVAPAVLGPVSLELFDIEPLWRVLIASLCKRTSVIWHAPSGITRNWFPGEVANAPVPASPRRAAGICADPRAEVVEALRWARALMSSGVPANCIGVASTMTEPYDEYLLALAEGAGIPVHFTHGRPALDTEDGQRCAALADVLLHGISQDA